MEPIHWMSESASMKRNLICLFQTKSIMKNKYKNVHPYRVKFGKMIPSG